MRVVMFYHSLVSDWNHGNAHFLRGVARELVRLGHDVHVREPRDGWSLTNLVAEHGDAPVARFGEIYPELRFEPYDTASIDLDEALDGADLVLVHEWNDHDLVRRIGEHRARTRGYRLLFHDTHHRAVTDAESMAAYDLSHYDGVLAFGAVIRDIYLDRGWTARAWVWHEAADTTVFHPHADVERQSGVVWVGNWGDEERTAELREFLFEPVEALGCTARVHGVRYPPEALEALSRAGIEFAGWAPNYEVPRVFARFAATVHVPRRPYVERLPGIPTIRMFEALACGIPLVSAPWDDAEGLFTPGEDYLVARDGREMTRHLRDLVGDRATARDVVRHGLRTILERHTCRHRVAELLSIHRELRTSSKGGTNPV